MQPHPCTRRIVAAGLALAATLALPLAAHAEYPEKPITMVVPYGAGGGTDLAARILATEMGKVLGQRVIVKNDAGGGGAVALGGLYNGKPDGYTIAVGTASNTSIIPHSTPVAYDPFKFTYIASYFGWPYIAVVHPSVPAKTLPELVAWAKANPGKLVAVTTGGFNIHEIGMGLLAEKSGGFQYRTLPTNSAAEGTSRVLAGDANFASGSPVTYMQHVKAGTLRAIAIVSDVTDPGLEAMKLPRTKDLYGYELVNTTVVIAPPGLPEPIRAKLEGAVKKSVENPEVVKALAALDFPVQFAPGPEALKTTQRISALYQPIVAKLLAARK
ncbi:MAG TPA: tripartite tricarboxylate transporter substrate binding protein [Ramlibacter sp.]|nr:tripartite tricarboxylate transporter substrate binding protein [Ramlibacter sp.]